MPVDTFSISNANYKLLMQVADVRHVSLSEALNGILDDARFRINTPRVAVRRQIERGEQGSFG